MTGAGPRPAVARAPAKVNLTLHVVARREDGYHVLDGLVAFSGAGDTVSLVPESRLSLVVDGPTAPAAGPTDDNLVLKALQILADLHPGLRVGALRLTKRLPVAAGLGGGSSDAAAALRLTAALNGLALDDPRILEAARRTGADVAMCLHPVLRQVGGIGDELGPPLGGQLFAILVNPGVAVPTPAVFAALGLSRGQPGPTPSPPPAPMGPLSRRDLMEAVGAGRNDLEPAARALAPVIGDVLAALRATPGCTVARMSGSGATCFGVYADCHAAARAARLLRRPGWWVTPTVLR